MGNKKYKFFVFTLALLLVLTGIGCKNNEEDNGSTATTGGEIELNWWRLWDSQDTFEPQIKAYEKAYPNITINYRKLTYAEYEEEVVGALASGKGPDIWSIHNTWLPKHIDKLSPMPEDVMRPDVYKETFVDVVPYNMTGPEGGIYGIPLSVDTLGLYYNKDYFNTAGISTPPENWNDFKENVKRLTQVDNFGNITQAGAAMGTANNINRAPDILYLLMLQNGTQMTNDKNTKATFDAKASTSDGETFMPGLDALIFYTDFANPKKTIYTWNPTMHNSVDAFIEENVAMMFSYSYQDEIIKSKAPRLNYGISYMPQIEGTSKEINYANYWSEVVSSTSPYQEQAWDFLAFLAKKENVQSYTELTGRPASRRDVIEEQLQDPVLKFFAKQALTAQSWYQADPSANDVIFSSMIESVALEETDPEEAIKDANDQVTATMVEDD